MSFFALLRVETGRLARDRAAWLLAALAILSPLAGYTLYTPAVGDSMTTLFLANPMLAGGMAGTVLFTLLTLLSLERPYSSGTAALTDTVVSPLAMHTARLLAVQAMALAVALLTGLFYLPYTILKLGDLFSPADYWAAVFLFQFSGLLMGSLAAAICHQITGRLDISLVAVLAFLVLSRSQWCRKYFLMYWNVPLAPALSDAFGSAVVWRTALYSRLVWLCLLVGGWLLSLLCVRQYGKGLPGSFLRHSRRVAAPMLAVTLLCAGGWLWKAQPFIDHSPEDWATAQQEDRYNENLILEDTKLAVSVDSYLLGSLSGVGAYQIRNHSGVPQELYFLLNPGYKVRSVTANGRPLVWEDLKNDMISSRELRCTLPADEMIDLEITYGGVPRGWNAQEDLLSTSYLSPDGLDLASMHLAPVVGRCAAVKDENTPVSLEIRLKNNLTLVSGGSTQKLLDHGDGTSTWRVEDSGTDRVRLFAGDYVEVDLEGGGMPIKFYYSRKYQKRLEGMGAIDMMEKAIAYCTEHYGPRTFTQDRPFKIIQMTVFEFGGFASGNVSGMGETYFSDLNLSDPVKGAASAEVLAHEIIHQWWGLGATLMDPEDNYWTDEGITTYTTYRLMREIMGEDYVRENYLDRWENAVADNAASFYQRYPEYIELLPERYANDVRTYCDGVNLYDGTALMIHRAAEKLGADKIDGIWSKLYMEGGEKMPPYITLDDFLSACGLKKEEIGRG